jgi:mono/diheme cytochrome c family protein
MSLETDNHKAQAREQSEPFERTQPVPLAVLLMIAGLFAWAIFYIAISDFGESPAMGDQRTKSALSADASASTTTGAAIDGAQLFATHCVACHQATGLGIAGAFPPLAGSEWVAGSPHVLAKILLHGVEGNLTVLGKSYAAQMPAFKEKLNDSEIAAVLSHIRSQWGNNASPITTNVVADARKTTVDRVTPWKGDIELNALPKD